MENIHNDAKMDVDDDWIMCFFEYAKNVTDDTVQQIWGKILSEQFNGDTSINRKLIHTLSLLDTSAALDFGKLSSITIKYSDERLFKNREISSIPFVNYEIFKYDKHVNPYDNEFLKVCPSKNSLKNLEDYGLISISLEKHIMNGLAELIHILFLEMIKDIKFIISQV